MKLKAIFLKASRYITTTIALTFILILYFATTTGGLKFIFFLTNQLTPYTLQYQQLDGQLLHHIQAKELTISINQQSITLHQLQLKCHWLALLKKQSQQPIATLQTDYQNIDLSLQLFKNKHHYQLTAHSQQFYNTQGTLSLDNHQLILSIKNTQNIRDHQHADQHITMNGKLNLITKQWALNAKTKGINLARWLKLPTLLNANIQASGNPTETNIAHFTLNGLINHKPVNLKLQGQIKAPYSLSHLNTFHTVLHYDHTLLDAHETTAHQLIWHASIPNLSIIHPDTTGQLSANGKIAKNTIQLNVHLQHLHYNHLITKAVSLNFESQLNTTLNFHLKLHAKHISTTWGTYQSALLDIHGTPNNHTLAFTLAGQHGQHVMTTFQGKIASAKNSNNSPSINTVLTQWEKFIKNTHWTLTLKHLTVRYKQQLWNLSRHLTYPVLTLYPSQKISLSPSCFINHNAKIQSICLQANYQNWQHWKAQLQLQRFPLQGVTDYLKLPLKTKHQLSGTINLHKNQLFNGQFHLNAPKQTIISTHQIQHNPRLPLELWASLSGKIHDSQLTAHFNIHSQSNQVNAELQTTLPKTKTAKDFLAAFPHNLTKLKSTTILAIPKLSQLNPILPAMNKDVSQLSGNLDATIHFNKPLNTSTTTGHAKLTNGKIHLSDYGLNLTNIQINAKTVSTFNQPQIDLSASCDSGKGHLQLTGNMKYTRRNTNHLPKNQAHSTFKLSGKNFQILNLPDYQVIANPNLLLRLFHHKITIDGSVTIPKATLAPSNFQNAVQLPSDIQITTEQKHKATPYQLYSHIQLIAGKQVALKVLNIAGLINGQLSINISPHAPALANGVLTLANGKYDAYGQHLTITRGILSYTNSLLIEPALNIQAIKKINQENQATNAITSPLKQSGQYQVGVEVTGKLPHPKVSLYSNPSLDDTKTLSLLILGRLTSPTENNSDNAQLLLQAANALSLGNSSIGSISNTLKNTLGLNEFGLQTTNNSTSLQPTSTNTQNTSFILGKYLSPRLFLSYSVGLIDPINTVSVTYRLDRHWSAQTNSNTMGTGGDLIYQIDSD